jgi:glycosyltransferase involved in cell wall biosynthesis
MTDVYVVVPEGIDDLQRPSGGNAYDRRICRGLASSGWSVHERAIPGRWPWPEAVDRFALAGVIASIPDGGVVLIDGLVASTVPDVLVPQARRLRLIVLVHMPFGAQPGIEGEEAFPLEWAVLSAAAAVVTTSAWTCEWLVDRYGLPKVHVAVPGVDPAGLAAGSSAGGRLLCVAAVAPHKGHDVLLNAVAAIPDLPWQLTCVGSMNRDPGFVERLHRRALDAGIADRLSFTGPLDGTDLEDAYESADVLVVPSRLESYGMVITEALARGLPVIASDVGGVREALGPPQEGAVPGLLVPSGDPAALSTALRSWLLYDDLRQRLRRAARQRRTTLSDWTSTTERISLALSEAAA